MFLFTEIKYDLDTTNIGKIFSSGQITFLFEYLSQPDDFGRSIGLQYCWNEDTTTQTSIAEFAVSAATPAIGYTPRRTLEYNVGFAARKGLLTSSILLGHFSFNIPLSHIFGFAEYKKVIYGHKHTLTLTRGADTQAIYEANIVTEGKVDITSISWHMLQIQLSPKYLRECVIS